MRLFEMMNRLSTVYQALNGEDGKAGGAKGGGKKVRALEAACLPVLTPLSPQMYDKPSPGRILSPKDPLTLLNNATIELYWPDDGMWYRADILSLNVRARSAKVHYATGDQELLELDEVIADGHLNVVNMR